MHDVAIVGAGPAGSALAIRLARAGLDVVIIDVARFPRDKVCGDFVNARGLAQLDALGCSTAIDALGCTPIVRSSTWLDDACIARADLPRLAGMPAHGLTVPRHDLDRVLFEQACARGARPRVDTRAIDFEHVGRGVAVRVEQAGHPDTIEARILVGADGAQSMVARRAGLDNHDPRYMVAAQRAYCRGLTLDETIVRFERDHFPGFGWVFPVRPGLCNVGVGMLSESVRRFDRPLPAQFDAMWGFVQRLAAQRGQTAVLEARRGWPIKVFGARQTAVFDSGLLVGEAASQVDPISGEGIPLALEMAELAAESIVDALAGDGPSALAGYDDTWRRRHGRDLGICDLFVTLTRNHHLRDVWIGGLESAAAIAGRDPHYAEAVGGVFAGLLPAQALFSPRVLLAGALRGSQLGTEAVLHALRTDPITAIRRAVEAQLHGVDVLRALWRDRAWSGEWLAEASEKQAALLRDLLTGGRR